MKKPASYIAALGLSAVMALASPVRAETVSFDQSWKVQRFSLFSGNTYGFDGQAMTLRSDGTVSLAYRSLPQADWAARGAAWSWEVTQSVPPTNLALKGGDDRNAALYFVFLPEAEALAQNGRANVARLLRNDAARVLVYVWGGNHRRGRMLDSPYLGPRGRTVVLRPSGIGVFSEQIDLAADYRRAFGGEAGALVGLAVSADSDDTDTSVRATIRELRLQ